MTQPLNKNDAKRMLSPEQWIALPAAVALILCAAATVFVFSTSADVNAATIQTKAEQDVARGDFKTACLRYEHLLALKPDQPEYAYQLAETLDRLKRRQEAMQVLSLIAPANADGYAPAHLQQAEWLIEAYVLGNDPNPDLLKAARLHLSHPFPDPKDQQRDAELRLVLDASTAQPQ